jgi:hypothetical protein
MFQTLVTSTLPVESYTLSFLAAQIFDLYFHGKLSWSFQFAELSYCLPGHTQSRQYDKNLENLDWVVKEPARR